MSQQPLAYLDGEFLESSEGRPIRILSEYLEPLRRFREQKIQDTVVFFGSARVDSRERAERALKTLRARGVNETDAQFQAELNRSKKHVEWARYYEDAREVARRLTAWSVSLRAEHHRFVVTSGGGPGIMEAANRGAHDVGAKSIGLNITLPREQFPNPYVTPELCFTFHYFAIRKLHFLLRARALVAFPGGYGTLDEIFEVLALAQTRKLQPVPVILVGESYWRQVFNPQFLIEEGVIEPEDRDLFWFAESADQIWRDILAWYEAAGRPLMPPGTGVSR